MKKLQTTMAVAALLGLTTGCNEYIDDLRDLGQRVEVLESSALNFTSQMEALKRIVATVERNGYITNLQQQDDAYIISFNDGKDPIVLSNGKKGQQGDKGPTGDKGVTDDRVETGGRGRQADPGVGRLGITLARACPSALRLPTARKASGATPPPRMPSCPGCASTMTTTRGR